MNNESTYFLCYDVKLSFGLPTSTRRVGKQKIDSYPHDKDFSLAVCRNLCDIFGQGTHWIEDETGQVIEDKKDYYD